MWNVLFDMDYTLFDSRQFLHGAFFDISLYLSKTSGHSTSAVMQIFLQQLEHGQQHILNRALRILGIVEHENLIADLVHLYRSHQPQHLSLYPDVLPTLQALRHMQCKLGLVTNGHVATQRRKVSALGLTELFDVIVCADALGRAHWKPSPAPYRQALDVLQSPHTEALYVGDDPQVDFQGARLLGMVTVRILRGEFTHVANDPACPPDHTIHSLEELVPLIGK